VSQEPIRGPHPGRRITFRRLATTALAAALAVACSGPRPARPPDILLISLDTLRADRLDALRDDGSPEMPSLLALARESIRFTDCFAPMAFTLPSHMTMMTGQHSETHYVVTEKSRLAPGVPVLAELLRQHGYRTLGFFSNSWLKPEFGFGRGFDVYREIPDELTYADRIAARIEAEVAESRKDPRPLFLFAHFYDAHSDFGADGNLLSYYSPPEFRRDLGPVDAAMCDAENRCATANLLFADREHRAVPEDQIRIHFELYRRGVRYLDAELGKLFDALRRTDFWSRALVVVVADHGEEFREHGTFIHSQVYREDLAVPLLVRLPGGRDGGRVDRRLVGLEDLAPTLLARLGIAAPASMQGRDLLAPPPESPRDAVEVAEDKLVRSRYSLRTSSELLVWDFADRSLHLFDRRSDPGARHDLAAERPDAARALRRRLFGELARLRAQRPELAGEPADAPEVFGAREREVLRSLGYLQ
jgi:arylsulfatase A-like enzyme